MKLAFIGCGNMATAIAKGVVSSKLFSAEEMIATDIIKDARYHFENQTAIPTTTDVALALQADFIILAIKPQQFSDFLTENAQSVSPTSTIISIAAGKKIEWIQSFFTEAQPIVRLMPNLNATISKATTAIAKNNNVSETTMETVTRIVQSFGNFHSLEESQFSTFTAIAGSSPAYFFKMIEAMSISAEQNGIDYDIAKQIIIDTMVGSALFAQASETPLPTLIKNVTSPKGTTEAALNVLNDQDFDNIIHNAQVACIQRDIELGK